MKFEDALAKVLEHEGGFVDDTRDPGGMTCLGVTRTVWQEWVGHPVTEKEMKALTPEKVAPLYKRKYWDKVKADQLPDGLDYSVFDFAVNSGIETAIRYLQRALGVADDGHFGAVSAKAAKDMNESDQIMRLNAERLDFMRKLKVWPSFGKGWAGRIAENLRYGATDS